MASLKLSTVRTLVQNSSLPPQEKESLIASAAQAAEVPDTWVYRLVVIALGLAIFIPLVMKDSATAQMLLPIATGALGALAGLLAPSPTGG